MIYIGTRKTKYGRMWMYHVFADTISELKTFCAIINVDEKYIHYKPNRIHLDICQSKKKEALGWKFPSIIEMKDSDIINRLFRRDQKG